MYKSFDPWSLTFAYLWYLDNYTDNDFWQRVSRIDDWREEFKLIPSLFD